MSEFFIHTITVILGGYLAFTNQLADRILAILPTEGIDHEVTNITALPSAFTDTLPRILIENASFQEAALVQSQGTPGAPAADIRDALVNIYCVYRTDAEVRQTTGTGFVVNQQGVVLTNAHVAQFLLLEAIENKGNTRCVVRTGEPASETYYADLLYISPAWVRENATQIVAAAPKGTGERDYALLYLSSRVDGTPLPARFPYLAIDTSLPRLQSIDDTVTIAGYPADPTSSDLKVTQSVATTTLLELYTFGTEYGDIYLLGGTPIGSSGISGGPVRNENNEVIAMISTRGDDTVQGAGSLNAITLSYIHRTMEEETGFGFGENISGNLRYRSEIFKRTLVPFLAQILSLEL